MSEREQNFERTLKAQIKRLSSLKERPKSLDLPAHNLLTVPIETRHRQGSVSTEEDDSTGNKSSSVSPSCDVIQDWNKSTTLEVQGESKFLRN